MTKNSYYILIGTLVAIVMIVFALFVVFGDIQTNVIGTMLK